MDDKKELQRKASKKFREKNPHYYLKYRFVDVLDYEIIDTNINDLRHKIENGENIHGTKC